MVFLVDANLGRKFTRLLNNAGYEAAFINDILKNASDEEILAVAERQKQVIITSDKDFGELIFKIGGIQQE